MRLTQVNNYSSKAKTRFKLQTRMGILSLGIKPDPSIGREYHAEIGLRGMIGLRAVPNSPVMQPPPTTLVLVATLLVHVVSKPLRSLRCSRGDSPRSLAAAATMSSRRAFAVLPPPGLSSPSQNKGFLRRGTSFDVKKKPIMAQRKSTVTFDNDDKFNERSVSVRSQRRSNNAIRDDKWTKLVVCLLIDFIGMSTYTVPALGETADVGWAPISAILVQYLFGNGLLTSVSFLEELLPGTDIIPTATIAWILENSEAGDRLTQKVGGMDVKSKASATRKED
eukprot:jgi/Bigna1/86471/estExt_fgenesh1_pg.C_100323